MFAAQTEQARRSEEAAQQRITRTLQREEEVRTSGRGVPCVGPGVHRDDTCGASTLPRSPEIAPLCTDHEPLRPQYVRAEDFENTKYTESKQDVRYKWMRTVVTRTEKE
jgi:hypothetical protein